MVSVSDNALFIYNPKAHRHYSLSRSLGNATFDLVIKNMIFK